MGGPCKVQGDEGVEDGPPCTDNFLVRPYMLNGAEWQSVEQFFQAYKYADEEVVRKFQQTIPGENTSASEYGEQVKKLGQERHPSYRKNWEQIRAEVMYRAKRAQIAQHPDLQNELIATRGKVLFFQDGNPFWDEWNGNCITRIRDEIMPDGTHPQGDQKRDDDREAMVAAYAKIIESEAFFADCPELVPYRAEEFSQEAAEGEAKDIMHEGELAMTQCGRKAAYHVVLYKDKLEYFSTQAALESGMPDGTFVLDEVEDLEVEDTSFLLHMNDGREILLEETAEGALQGWVDAFSEAFESDEPLGGTVAEEPHAIKELTSTPAGHTHSGTLHLVVGPGSEVPRYVVMQDGRIELFESQDHHSRSQPPLTSISAEDVTRVNIHDNAFVVGVGGEQLELRVPQGAVLDGWVSALRAMLGSEEDGYHTPSTEATPTMNDQGSPRADALPLEQEMADSRVVTWLDSMPDDGPRFHGVLWLSRERRLVPKFAALFTKHFDFWATPLQAAGGKQPDVRILLNEVHGMAVVGGGFVIDHRGHKMGIHVGDRLYLQEWSRALQSALSLESGGPTAVSPTADADQDRAPKGWVPRVAKLRSPRQVRTAEQDGAPRPKSPGPSLPERKNGSPFRSATAGHLAAARRQVCRRDPHDLHGAAAMKSWQEASAKLGTSTRNRNFSPRSPLERDAFAYKTPEWSGAITGKINKREVPLSAVSAKGDTPPLNGEKVSGPRIMSPRGESKVAPKITGPTRPPAAGSRHGPGEAPLSPKVHEGDRGPLRRRPPAGTAVTSWQPAPSPAGA